MHMVSKTFFKFEAPMQACQKYKTIIKIQLKLVAELNVMDLPCKFEFYITNNLDGIRMKSRKF